MVLNKKKKPGQVRVMTVDGGAKAGDDYGMVDKVLTFAEGEPLQMVNIDIMDDDEWEPDEDFFVQLYDVKSRIVLSGADTRARVTIIDDDEKPEEQMSEEQETHKADQIPQCSEEEGTINRISRSSEPSFKNYESGKN